MYIINLLQEQIIYHASTGFLINHSIVIGDQVATFVLATFQLKRMMSELSPKRSNYMVTKMV